MKKDNIKYNTRKLNRSLQVLLYFVLFFSLDSINLYGQGPISWTINSNDNLPSNIVYRIEQDDIGQIWIATDFGIVKYDGKEVQEVKVPNLRDHFIAYLYKDSWGNIWFRNVSGQLYVAIDGEVKEVEIPPSNPNRRLEDIFIIEDRLILNEYYENNKCIKSFQIDEAGNFSDEIKINFPQDLNYFLAAPKNELIFSSANFVQYDKKLNLLSSVPIQGDLRDLIYQDGQIRLIYNLRDNSLLLFEDDVLLYKYIFSKKVNQIEYRGSKIYALTTAGYHEIDIEQAKIIVSDPIMENLNIHSIYVCRENLLWISTATNGVHVLRQFNNKIFKIENEKDRLSSIESITKGKDGIYFGTNNGEVFSFKNNKMKELEDNGSKINEILFYKEALYYCNTKGVFVIKAGQGPEMITNNSDASNVKDFCIYGDDNVGFALGNGNYLKNKNRPGRLKRIQQIRSYAIAIDPDNIFWFGTLNGIFFYDEAKSELNKLEDDFDYNISDIEIINDSISYVSTFGSGVFEFINRRVNRKINLPSDRILDIHYQNEHLAVASVNGAYLIDLLNNEVKGFSKDNYLPSNNTASVLIDKDTLWVGTDKGLCQIMHKQLKDEQTINFSKFSFSASGVLKDLRQDLRFSKKDTDFEISYKAINFKNRNITYLYRLLGKDSSWTKTKNDVFKVSSLKPGQYIFEVKAMDSESRESEVKSISFEIEKSLIDYLLTKLVLLFLFGGLVYAGTLKYSNLKDEEKFIEQQQQKEIDGMKMTALQNHMNPHFISNALYSIRELIENKDTWEASDYTANFADLIRKSMRYASLERISLKQEIEFLRIYLAMEKTRLKKDINTKIKLSENLKENIQNILLPPLLIQPLIENSFKHANLATQQSPYLFIELELVGQQILCFVKDNGIGFGHSKKERKQLAKSTGINTIKQRLSLNSKQLSRKPIKEQMTIKRVKNGVGEEYTEVKMLIDIKLKNE